MCLYKCVMSPAQDIYVKDMCVCVNINESGPRVTN